MCANKKSEVNPTVLLISTCFSYSAARLSMAMTARGFRTEALCPTQHALCKIRTIKRVYPYHCLAPVRSVKKAIFAGKPDLVIPCDDWAAWSLRELYIRELRKSNPQALIPSLIERSLGAPQSFQIAPERTAVLELAKNEGLRVPNTRVVRSNDDLKKWESEVGFPAVLKANDTSGGAGVRIVHTLDEAVRAFSFLEAPPMLAKALKRVLFDKNMALLWPAMLRKRHVVNVQAFVEGRDATSAVACWKGQALASLHFEVVNKQDAGGPSTVLRLIENRDMIAATQQMARRLQLSGLYGFDFILEPTTGYAHLIEINPRATQVEHLALGPGHDLPAALYAALTGSEIRTTPSVTAKDTIALFPQEWLKNPASEFLHSAYHDVPWEEPEFVAICFERRKQQNSWHSVQKWVQALSKIWRTQF
jgi:hypothetical protein